jgi:hypothetical protein
MPCARRRGSKTGRSTLLFGPWLPASASKAAHNRKRDAPPCFCTHQNSNEKESRQDSQRKESFMRNPATRKSGWENEEGGCLAFTKRVAWLRSSGPAGGVGGLRSHSAARTQTPHYAYAGAPRYYPSLPPCHEHDGGRESGQSQFDKKKRQRAQGVTEPNGIV